ncbi:TlyA family RNA methyltransferase [Candidatus Saccharibacteria bacterium]|nr:TlyA family RNA methyltransferase [Candidatus Saccharibacteria bacterium]
MNKIRLDQALVQKGLVATRSQAESYIKLGFVLVNGQPVLKPGLFISKNQEIKLNKSEKYVSRAGFKLEAANKLFKINFKNKIVLDVGSSTGGFTDYALQNGSAKIIAVDIGTNQLHPKLRGDKRIELHEKTDIRNFQPRIIPDIILMDISFISARLILQYLVSLCGPKTQIIVLLKPQFEAGKDQINRGVVKNDRIRRRIFKDYENWTKKLFKTVGKTDSKVSGSRGNLERFYLLEKI